jgi:hypothetical protein
MASRRSQATFNPTLTNYATGQAQELASALARIFAPTVEVGSTVGKFKKYDDKNAFQAYRTNRAVGGQTKRIEFLTTDGTYDAAPHGLEIPIDDSERDAAGGSAGLPLDQAKIRTLISAAVVSHEVDVIAAAKALSAVGGTGVWSTPSTGNPISEIDAQILAISNTTGMMPNTVVFGIGAWRHFRNSDAVVGRQPGSPLIGLSPGEAGRMFLNPAINVHVGTLVSDSVKFPKAASKTNIVGDEVFIFIRSENPTDYDPSWMKTFMGARGGVTAVETYRDERHQSDIHRVKWSRDIQIVSSIAARRITVT